MSSVILKFNTKYIENISVAKLSKEVTSKLENSGLNAMENVFNLAVKEVPFRTGDLADSGDLYVDFDNSTDDYSIINIEFDDIPHFEVDVPIEGEKHTTGLDSPITTWASADTEEDMYIQSGDKNYLSNSFEATPIFDLICREFSHTFFK